jgi:hypothetical protein
MRKNNWIGTQHLYKEIQKLIPDHDIVFIEFEIYTVLEKLEYSTNLFKAEWDKWNYYDPNNLLMIRDELIRYPNDTRYLEIDTKTKFYNICNFYHKHSIIEKSRSKIADVTTIY